MPIRSIAPRIRPRYKSIAQSRFIRGLQRGSLSQAAFTHFLKQDMLYLHDYVKVMHNIARKVTKPHSDKLHFLAKLTQDTIVTYQRYFEQNKLSAAAEKTETCRNYTTHILDLSEHGKPTEALAAMIPCNFFYHLLAEDFRNNPTINNKTSYFFWIKDLMTYVATDDGFTNSYDCITKIIAEYAAKDLVDTERLVEIALKSAQYEFQLFEDSINYADTKNVRTRFWRNQPNAPQKLLAQATDPQCSYARAGSRKREREPTLS